MGEHSLCNRLVADIDQTLLDLAAAALYPNATPQTRNRKFYTPVSAVLKRAGIEWRIKRPKGWAGKKSKWWLLPEQAFALIAAATAINAEFGLLCLMLLYTGMRISEALDAKLRHLNLHTENRSLYLPETKNSEARSVLSAAHCGRCVACNAAAAISDRRHVANRRWCAFPQARSRCQAVPISSRQPAYASCWRARWRMLVSRSRRATAASICSATLTQVGWLASTRWIIMHSPAPAAGKTRVRPQAMFTPTSRRKRITGR